MIIYLAGGETWWERFRAAKIRNQLFSFFYLRRSRGVTKIIDALYEQRESWQNDGKPFRLFLDSGAFTYQGDKGSKKPSPPTYFNEFKAFVKATGDLWTVVAELDIDVSPKLGISVEQVDEWRDELYDVRGSALIMPVWHENRGIYRWEHYVADPRFPYLGFGSRIATIATKNRLSAIAHRAGKIVHGFAETKIQTDIKYLKCDSVDSSTWLRATKYGGLFIFQGNQFRVLDHKHKDQRKLFIGYFRANGLRYEIITKDEDKIPPDSPEYTEYQEELTKCSLVAWRLLADRYEQMGRHKYEYSARAGREDVRDGADLQTQTARSRLLPGGQSAIRGDKAQGDRGEVSADGTRAPSYPEASPSEDYREQPGVGGTTMARVRSPQADSDGSNRNRFTIVRAPGQQGAGLPAQAPADSSEVHSADGADRDAEESQDLPVETIVPPEFHRDRHVRIVLKRHASGKLTMADCTISGQRTQDKVPAYQPEATPAKPSPRLPAALETARMKGDILLPIPNERERNDKSEGLGHNKNRHHATDEEIGLILSHYAYHNYPPIDRETAASQFDLLRMIRTGRYRQLQEQGSPDVMPLPNCECGHPKAKHENGTGRCDHDSRDSQGSVMFACLCTAYTTTYEQADRLPKSPGCANCGHPKSAHQSMDMEAGYTARDCCEDRQAEGKACHYFVAPKSAAQESGTVSSRDTTGDTSKTSSRDSDPAHVGNSSTIPLVAKYEPQQNQVPGEGKASVTMTVEGRKHLPVLPLGGVLTHDPDIQAGLDALSEIPGTACDTCPAQGQCKEYQAGALCYYESLYAKLQVRDARTHKAIRERLLQHDWKRTNKAMLLEEIMGGGQLDPRVSQQLASFRQHLAEFEEATRINNTPPPTMTASVSITGAGAARAAPGVLTQLFGGAMRATELELENTPSRDPNIIDSPPEPKDVPK